MGWMARAHDGRYFRRPSPAERAVIDLARDALAKGWDTGDEKLQKSAYLILRKTIDSMRIEGTQIERSRYLALSRSKKVIQGGVQPRIRR